MHSALFVVTMPDNMDHPEAGMRWSVFLTQFLGKIEQAKNVWRLAENVWLVDMAASPGALARMITAAENQTIAYGILPFDGPPQWLPGGFDPKTIRGRNAS